MSNLDGVANVKNMTQVLIDYPSDENQEAPTRTDAPANPTRSDSSPTPTRRLLHDH